MLVIDDDPVIRDRFRVQLESAGYLVEVAEDGEAAIARVRHAPVDLVILDVMMPRKGGVETMVEIAQILDHKPATIVVTGMDLVDTDVFRNLTEKLGVRHVLKKPVEPESLLGAVRELTG